MKPGMDMSWHCLPLRIQTFTGFLPLWCGLAKPAQAKALVQTNYLADDRFCGNWGVRSLSSKETMYCMDFSSNPSNWLGPVWIIVNYFVWKGLKDYGFHDEAVQAGRQDAATAVCGSCDEWLVERILPSGHRNGAEPQRFYGLESTCAGNGVSRFVAFGNEARINFDVEHSLSGSVRDSHDRWKS